MKKLLLFYIFFFFSAIVMFAQQTSYTPADGSYTLAMGPNDDGSSSSISLPFSFCLYGINYTSVYINNNGNISFGTSYSTFSSTGFPSASFVMIAPFWADVDTRPSNGGTVKYKLTSTALYINWDAVGYYNQETDKLNSFQLIITNGTDPVLPVGDNIGFFYGDMQWTTGSASSGTNGFGGTPATVGINKGDGANFFQIGQFDHSGTGYDGPQGNADGVDWLDNQYFYFDGCTFPTAIIIGTTTVCNNASSPNITFIGDGGTAPYTFTYTLNGGSNQTITTTSGDSVSITVPTNTTGSFTYNLVSVQSAASSTVAQTQGSATVTVNPCTMATATITGTDTVCKNANPPTITFIGSLGTAPYTFTYNINGGSNQTLTTTSDSTATVTVPTSVPGTYTYNLVSVKDATATTPSPANGSAIITVILPTASISGTTTVCQNDTPPYISLTGAGGIAPYTFTYNVNNSANLTATSTGNTALVPMVTLIPGIFTFNLISVKDSSPDSCSQSQSGTATITVNPLPTATISGTTTVCMNDSAPEIILKGASATPPYSIVYAINGVNQPAVTTQAGDSIVIAASTGSAGTFVYSLISVQDASATACIQSQSGSAAITVKSKPHAAFGGANVCFGNALQFTDSSSTPTGTIANWNWNFGDGSSVNTSQNPSYIYTSPGTYTVTLTVNNSLGCSDSDSKTIKIYPNPTAGFNHNNVCLGDSIHFVSTSYIDTASSIYSYLWIFGDGSTPGNLTNPVHYYSGANTYNVALIVTSVDGCTGVSNTPVNTFALPVASFTFNNACLQDSAHIQNTSTPPADGTISSWKWTWGDNTPADSSNWLPAHLYNATGSYTIGLIVRSSNLGCADTIQDTIQVFPKPTANFGYADVCFNDNSVFTDSSVVNIDSIIIWSWNFGDNSVLNTTQNPTHLYSSPQTFNVTLKVTTNHGCIDSVSKATIIHPLPTVMFSSPSVCDGTDMFFNNNSMIENGDMITSYNWTFGDGSANSTNQETSHLYSSVGSYNVSLTAVSNFGCVGSHTQTGVVNPLPSVNFTAGNAVGCEPMCVTFNNQSAISPGTNKYWLWNFGDNAIDSAENPVHCYFNDSVSVPVLYSVTLSVTSDSGCTSSKTIDSIITVYPKPQVNFTASPTTTTTIVTSAIEVIDASLGVNSWNWDFGDLYTSASKTPVPHTYGDTGIFPITLIGSTIYGCSDTAYQYITVEPDFVFYIPNTFSPNNDDYNDVFLPKGVFVEEFQMMIFDRWGNLVFHSSDINEGWNGKANSGDQAAQQDVYVYSIHLRDSEMRKHSYNGTVTIIR